MIKEKLIWVMEIRIKFEFYMENRFDGRRCEIRQDENYSNFVLPEFLLEFRETECRRYIGIRLIFDYRNCDEFWVFGSSCELIKFIYRVLEIKKSFYRWSSRDRQRIKVECESCFKFRTILIEFRREFGKTLEIKSNSCLGNLLILNFTTG